SMRDSSDSNYMTGSRLIVGGASTSITSLSVWVGAVDSAPRNQFALAIYTDTAGAPGTLLAPTATGTLTANAWNTLQVSATLNAGTAYWLIYNANGGSESVDNMAFNPDPANVGAYAARTFGTWPTAFGAATLAGQRYSMYASGT